MQGKRLGKRASRQRRSRRGILEYVSGPPLSRARVGLLHVALGQWDPPLALGI